MGLGAENDRGRRGGAYTWESPIKTEDDVEKLRLPEMRVDRDATGRLVALPEEE